MLSQITPKINAFSQLSILSTPSCTSLLEPCSPSLNNSDIQQLIANFICLSPSKAPESHYIARISQNYLSNSKSNGVSVEALYRLVNDSLNRIIAQYVVLRKNLNRDTKTSEERCSDQHKVLREVSTLVTESRLEWSLIWWLDSLARFANENPESSFTRKLYIVCRMLTSRSVQICVQQSQQIQMLLNTILNASHTIESTIWLNYIRFHVLNNEIFEDRDHILNFMMFKSLNSKCLASDIMNFDSLINFHTGLDHIKHKAYPVGSPDDDFENHEEYSTTSGSSRTIHDCHSHNGQKTITVSCDPISTPIYDIMYELYDGCFFGDLAIPFGPEDKLLIPEEEFQEKTYAEASSSWDQEYYRYQHKAYAYEPTKKQSYPSHQEKHSEGSRKGYYISYEPKQKISEPVVQVSLPVAKKEELFVSDNSNFPGLADIHVKDTTKQSKYKGNQANRKSELTVSVSKVLQIDKRFSATFIGEKSREFHSNVNEKSGRGPNSSLLPSSINLSPLKAKNSWKSQRDSKAENTKKKMNTNLNNSSKGQDRGEFKLWDMINVKGKLKV